MAVSDWVSNLYQSEQTRGLSGGARPAVALDDANPYYNYKLRRHRTMGDLIDDPNLLWFTSSFVENRDGLGVHLATEHGDGVAGFTDVLIVLSADDYAKASQSTDEPWLAKATRTLLAAFESYCTSEGFSLRYPHRKLGFRFLADGSPQMGGRTLGLQAGEFITGLLPNLYTGPVKGSQPVIGLHINLPGAWEGYREVGRLYSDQVLFTLGASWLDNFSHPNLREAALYRLRRDEDGQFVHILNPDLQDRYQLTSTDQGDSTVLTLATRSGEPLAYMVLALLDTPERADDDQIAPPMLIDGEVQRVSPPSSRTILPEAPSERIFTLQERGALLQKVHFRKFMLGYDVYLGARGELGTVVDEKAATFQVRRTGVSLLAHIEGIEVEGTPLPVGEPRNLEGDCAITALGQRLEYRDLSTCRVDKWPYVAEIRRPASSNYMMWGERYNVGRALDARVVLPDNPDNRNIHWRPEVGDGTTIRARSGDIEKSRFYTDSIMVASNHAVLDLETAEPNIICTARNCFVYVRRYGAVFPLYPTKSGLEPTEMGIEPGDELLIGNSVFYVGFTPTDDGVQPAPAPSLTVDALVGAASAPDFAEVSAEPEPDPSPPLQSPEPPPDPVLGTDAPAPDEGSVVFDDLDAAKEPEPSPSAEVAVEWEEEDSWETPARQPARDVAPSTPESPDATASPQAEPAPVAEPAPEVEPTPVAEPAASPEPSAAERPRTAESAPIPPPRAAAPPSAHQVAFVDEDDAKFELARDVHLIHTGWSVVGELTLGNHSGADLILPENRIDPDQTFEPTAYFALKVRGRRSSLTVRAASEFLFDEADVSADSFEDLVEIPIDVIRRDDAGDEDFAVRLMLLEDPTLPNPRARFLAIDTLDKLTQALVTRGLPLNQGRPLALGPLRLTATTDGSKVTITDYVESYRKADGTFEPFFVQYGDEPFRTAPEDGSPIVLDHDDRLLIGHAMYLVQRR